MWIVRAVKLWDCECSAGTYNCQPDEHNTIKWAYTCFIPGD